MEIKKLEAVREFGADRFTKRILFQKGGSVAFVLHFMPGQELPAHKHPGTAVYILVLEGSGTIIVDGAATEVYAEDAIGCEGNEQFSFQNTGSVPTRLYVVLSRIPDERYAQDV